MHNAPSTKDFPQWSVWFFNTHHSKWQSPIQLLPQQRELSWTCETDKEWTGWIWHLEKFIYQLYCWPSHRESRWPALEDKVLAYVKWRLDFCDEHQLDRLFISDVCLRGCYVVWDEIIHWFLSNMVANQGMNRLIHPQWHMWALHGDTQCSDYSESKVSKSDWTLHVRSNSDHVWGTLNQWFLKWFCLSTRGGLRHGELNLTVVKCYPNYRCTHLSTNHAQM